MAAMGRGLKYKVRVAEPCREDWARMSGDARERYCEACERHVHNLAALTTWEIERLIETSRGNLCGRIERTTDGRVVTADLVAIDSGWKGIAMRTPALAGTALAAVLSVAGGASAQSSGPGGAAGTTQTAQAASATTGAPTAAPDSAHAAEPVTGRVITVVAPDGSGISGAKVVLTKRDDKRAFTLTTDEAGRASLHGIPHGDYDVAASAPGFANNSMDDISLPANTRVTLFVGAMMGVFVVEEPNRNPIKHFYHRLKTYL